MRLSRRDFLKLSGTTVTATASGLTPRDAAARGPENRVRGARVSRTVCPYCAVGCGMLVHTMDGRVVNIEGDTDHPINRGSLCSKGASLIQVVNNPKRLTRPLYRAPGAGSWREVEWDWALDRIARRIKDTRDRTWVEQDVMGRTVRRCDGIAHVGSAALDNEECYLLQKWLRSLGLVAIEHQARI